MGNIAEIYEKAMADALGEKFKKSEAMLTFDDGKFMLAEDEDGAKVAAEILRSLGKKVEVSKIYAYYEVTDEGVNVWENF